jgi:hypothetical protein
MTTERNGRTLTESDVEIRYAIVNDSDVTHCLHGCGCRTKLPADFHVNLAWYADIEPDPYGDGGSAVVLCPTCWGGQCFDPDAEITKKEG